ncbi:phosphatase PAP2 family protein [Terriglobus albidus]|uniref:phosphatase PAP2 family protein n=1 Tax=Terriglobus albidus TaxID=1592106 RepID=UPI0021E0A434|nr:phosphatase PAP2 family protein [Terriglobus albidus]
MNRTLAVLAFALTIPVFAAHAQAPTSKPAMLKKLKFLTDAETDPSKILPPPAADGSEAQQKEMKEVKALIHNRSKERHDQAIWDARNENPSPFITVLGPELDLAKLPATKKLLDDVLNEQNVATSHAKDYFKRKFPLSAADDNDTFADWTCDVTARKPAALPLRSYPSGHATMGFTLGVVLSDLVPEKSQALLARSATYAYSREVCGDHYHSDTQAGQVLGTVLGFKLLKNEALRPEIEAARAELQAATKGAK